MELRKLIIAVDGSQAAKNAVQIAGALASKIGSEVLVVHVMTDPGDNTLPNGLRDLAQIEHVRVTEFELRNQAAQAMVDKAAARLRALGVSKVSGFVDTGDPATQLVEIARREQPDIIVMGRRGRGRLGGLLLGSVTYKVAQTVAVPCLTVP
jgi:nucleotide-binding universal stress UspA family protein